MFGSNGPRLTQVSTLLRVGNPGLAHTQKGGAHGAGPQTCVNRGPFEPNMVVYVCFVCPMFVNSRSFQRRSSWPAAPILEPPLAETSLRISAVWLEFRLFRACHPTPYEFYAHFAKSANFLLFFTAIGAVQNTQGACVFWTKAPGPTWPEGDSGK